MPARKKPQSKSPAGKLNRHAPPDDSGGQTQRTVSNSESERQIWMTPNKGDVAGRNAR